MTDYRPTGTTPPQNPGGRLWAVLVGVVIVVTIVGLLAWWWWPEGDGSLASPPSDAVPTMTAPATDTAGETNAPVTTPQ